MKYSLILCLTCFFLTISCDSTSSSEEDTYSITVTNSFDVNVDIYTQEGDDGTQTKQGTIAGSSSASYSGFEFEQVYIITATEESGTPDNWYYQTEFSNESSNTLEINITPQF